MKNNNRKIDGRFWLTNNGEYFAGRGRIELLKHIKETGSIAPVSYTHLTLPTIGG